MKHPIIYVELKSGYSDNGPAWIGKARHSKTGKMIYFNGKALRALTKRQNFESHIDIETGEYYWVSGVKKDQADRHWAGSGKVMIDQAVVEEYMAYVGVTSLSKSKYQIVQLDNTDMRDKVNQEQNAKLK